MSAVRWMSVKAAMVGPSGRETLLVAKVPDPDRGSPPGMSVTLLFTALIFIGGLFVWPILLLGIPLLVLRSAVTLMWMNRNERVALDAFTCPECSSESPGGEWKGELPIEVGCAWCGAGLTVGQIRRVYDAAG